VTVLYRDITSIVLLVCCAATLFRLQCEYYAVVDVFTAAVKFTKTLRTIFIITIP
jgi:hypothetical protein